MFVTLSSIPGFPTLLPSATPTSTSTSGQDPYIRYVIRPGSELLNAELSIVPLDYDYENDMTGDEDDKGRDNRCAEDSIQ